MTGCLSILKVNYNFPKFQDSDNIAQIKPFQNHLDKCRIDAHNNIINLVTEIRKSLETLKLDVFKVLNKKNDVNYLRNKMLGMEEKIVHTKEKIQEELIKALENEKVLVKDIKYFENHLENWGKSLNTNVLKPSKFRSFNQINSSHLNNPTVILQKFISESGGPYGGWLEQDHLLFVREQKKNKDKKKFYASIHGFLPNLTDNDISEHESWCLKYETLRAAQKKAIQKWKEKKTHNQYSNSEKKFDDNEVKKKIKRPVNRANIVERIKEWRKNQNAKKIEEIERQVQEKKLFQKQERAKMNKIQQFKKLAISQYKAEKVKKLQSELPVEEQKVLSVVDKAKKKILLKTFQLQDIRFIEKKKSIRLELESKAANKFHSLKLTKPPIDFFLQRDPKRILKPTLNWTQHIMQKSNSKEKLNQFINLNTIPKLAVPEWRKELIYN